MKREDIQNRFYNDSLKDRIREVPKKEYWGNTNNLGRLWNDIEKTVKPAAGYIRELLYPRRCPICEDIVIPKGKKICAACKALLIYVKEPYCKKCGKPVAEKEQEYCFDCSRREYRYDSGLALFVYDQTMKNSIAAFKFHGKKEYADFYVEEMAAKLGERILAKKPDVLIPVPVHRKKKRFRGFNQAELLASGLSRTLGIPMDSRLLVRIRNTAPQKEVNGKERMKNLECAFGLCADAERVLSDYRHIMLVDDIYTTGSTIEACSRVLLSNGIPKVSFVSLCIGKGY